MKSFQYKTNTKFGSALAWFDRDVDAMKRHRIFGFWAYLKLYKMFICKWLQAKWLHINNPKAYVKVSKNFLWMSEWIDVKCIDLPTFQTTEFNLED